MIRSIGRPSRIPLWVQLAFFGVAGVIAMHALHLMLGNQIATQALTRQEERLGRSIARIVSDQAADPLLAHDKVSLNVIASATASGTDSAVVYCFITHGGTVIASSIAGGTPPALAALRAPGDFAPIVVRDGEVEVLDIAEPILGNVGVVRLGFEMKTASETRRALTVQLGLLALGVIGAGVVAAFGLGRRIARPLHELVAAADRFDPARADRTPTVTPRGSQEVAALGERFNHMAQRLRAAHSEKERASLKSAETERMVALGSLVAGMAHEVNNPLAGLRNCVHRLERPDLSLESRAEYLHLMREGLLRIEEVVKRLLDFGRPHPAALAPERISELARASTELMRPALEEAQVHCRIIEEPGADGLVLADRHQVGQSLVNLLLNAACVTPKGGEIRLRLCAREGFRGIAVEDDGPGIPVELRERVCDPFFTTKAPGEGTGLGLSVTRSIVDAQGGELAFHFPEPGGTVATVWLKTSREDLSKAG